MIALPPGPPPRQQYTSGAHSRGLSCTWRATMSATLRATIAAPILRASNADTCA